MTISLLEAMDDPHLFKPWFKDKRSWLAWRVVVKALFGLPLSRLTRSESTLFTKLTGRTIFPIKQAREAWLIAGRRGGKSFIAALTGVYLAAFMDYRRYLSPGERATVMVLAADRKQARTIMRYATALVQGVPMLSKMIERVGLESVDLNNAVTLEIHTASFRSVRGYTLAAVLADETAFWRSDESANPDTEILAALRPAMATIPNALLLCLSSPYARRGALWNAYQEHYGRDGDPVLVFRGDTLTLNPTVPEQVIDQAYRDDPAAAAAEYGAEFRSDVASFLEEDWIDAAISQGVYELPPAQDVAYVAFTDPSGGSKDAFTIAIAHTEGQRLVLDVARARRPPFDPHVVISEYAVLLKRYGLSRVSGDRYAAEFVVSAFRDRGVHYEASLRTKSDIYLEVLPLFATRAIQLLDIRQLQNELRQLERCTGRGRDIVDHPPRAHDDLANAACGALLSAVKSSPVDLSDALLITPAELRAARDEHLVDLGYAGDFGIDESNFKESS